ncbi:MAG TPA: response regulator [Lysobacter sp.]|nr:response regulator [Lysobacter sp.]
MTDHRPFRALLVEDDAVSAAFLEAALARVPLQVDLARDCAQARLHAAASRYDLWVFDANLPDGRGDALLHVLRGTCPTPAIAHTAAREVEEHERLLAAGFLEVLVKPLSTAEIVAAARMALGLVAEAPSAAMLDGTRPLWDDDAALRALLGDRGHLIALRGLFRPELEGLETTLRQAIDAGGDAEVRSVLHRLRASCGFVGAARLGDAAAMLAADDARSGWPAFVAVLRETLDQFPAD